MTHHRSTDDPSTSISFAPQLMLVPDRPDHWLILDSPVGDRLRAIEPWRLLPPICAKTRSDYLRRVRQFERFCIYEGVIGQLDEAHLLDQPRLEMMVEQFVSWLVNPVDADHPLLFINARDPDGEGGWRGKMAPVKTKAFLNALIWWARVHSRVSPISAKATLLATTGPSVVRKARAMSDEEICAAALALYRNHVWRSIPDPLLRRIIHARELAALNVQVASAHRPGERVMLVDRFVVDASPDEVVVKFPRTKHNSSGRLINLRARDDILCPVWALNRFHRLLEGAGLGRDGYLLPGISTRSATPMRAPDYGRDRKRWNDLMGHIGVLDEVDVREGRHRASPHCVRATLATNAFAAGWTHTDVMAVGGWQSLNSAAGYNRGSCVQDTFIAGMAADLEAES